MSKKNIIKNRGFTLTETIVVIFIFTLLAIGVTTLFTNIFVNSRERLSSIDNIDQASLVATKFTNQIRVASVGNDGSYPINQAGDTQIIFYSNYGQATGTIARVRYYLNKNTLYKGVVIPTGTPLSYNLGAESITTVQKDIINFGTPIFYYYNGDYTGSSTPLTQPISINQVKYVQINLDILKKDTKTATTTFTISAGASIRNLKINLGN
jgi:prepilin-type N-terminal cleavage/methylation domain-containing protein